MNKQIHELSVIELLNGLEDKRYSSVEIVKHYLDRINRFNQQLNIYLHINENALKLAEEAGMEVVIMNGNPITNLANYLNGEKFSGTVIS